MRAALIRPLAAALVASASAASAQTPAAQPPPSGPPLVLVQPAPPAAPPATITLQDALEIGRASCRERV